MRRALSCLVAGVVSTGVLVIGTSSLAEADTGSGASTDVTVVEAPGPGRPAIGDPPSAPIATTSMEHGSW